MTNNQNFSIWNQILFVTQIIHLILGLSFAYQQKYQQALVFFMLSGVCIGLGRNQHSIIKFFNRVMWSLGIVVTVHWYSQ